MQSNRRLEVDPLGALVRDAVAAGVDLIQIREKDLPARDLVSITTSVCRIAGDRAQVLVNDRPDVAAVCQAAGVHLTAQSLDPRIVRRAFGESMIIGVSTHSVADVVAAEAQGADFVVFGPVFETESKRAFGPPVGVNPLRDAVLQVSLPVIALGGITSANFREALDSGAAGIAGISLFIGPEDPDLVADLVKDIKSYKQ